MLSLICILVESAAGVHTGVTSLITTPVVLSNLSGPSSFPVAFAFFSVSIQEHQHTPCVGIPSLEHKGHLGYPKKDFGSQGYCLNSSFFLLPTVGALLFLSHHLRQKTKSIFKFPLAQVFPILSPRKKAICLKSSISPCISKYI